MNPVPTTVRTSASRPWYDHEADEKSQHERTRSGSPRRCRTGTEDAARDCTGGVHPERANAPAAPASATHRSHQSSSSGSKRTRRRGASPGGRAPPPPPHGGEPGTRLTSRYSDRERRVAVADQQHALDHPGGEGGETTAEADRDERPQQHRGRRAGSRSTVRAMPSTNEPTRLTMNVAHGNCPDPTGSASAIS